MADLTKEIIAGARSAMEWVKTLLTNPALICTEPDMPFYIPIMVSSNVQRGDAQISERTIIAQGETRQQKKIVADNIAPGVWQWTLSGYLIGAPEIELTNLFTPIVRTQKELLRAAFKRGVLLTLKDGDCMPYLHVGIQSIQFRTEPDCLNFCPVDITIKQLNIMSVATGVASETMASATPAAGTADGAAAEAGMTTGNMFSSGDSWLYQILTSLF